MSTGPHRLDLLARAIWNGGERGALTAGLTTTRRGVVGVVLGAAAGLLAQGSPGVAADSDETTGCTPTPGAGGSSTQGATVSSAQVPENPNDPPTPRPARIYEGTCLDLAADPAFQLLDVGSGRASGASATPAAGGSGSRAVGVTTAVPGQVSLTLVGASLPDLLASPHAIAVFGQAGGDGPPIACGDVGGRAGGQISDDDLVFGLRERSGSGYSGLAWLRGDTDRTLVHVFLARGLAEGPAGVGGESLTVTEDGVNVRAAASTDAEVVGTLDAGIRVTTLGPAADGWIEVSDPLSGVRGFVLQDYLK